MAHRRPERTGHSPWNGRATWTPADALLRHIVARDRTEPDSAVHPAILIHFSFYSEHVVRSQYPAQCSILILPQQREGATTTHRLFLKLRPAHSLAGSLTIQLDDWREGDESLRPFPAWISLAPEDVEHPRRASYFAAWLVLYARSVVAQNTRYHRTNLVPWWRIIRFLRYALVST